MATTTQKTDTMQYITTSIETRDLNVDDRLITLAFSSEQPVDRGYGYEILSHDDGAVILDRLNTNAPLLVNHDTNQQTGVVVKAWLDSDRVCRAVVKFGNSPLASEIYQDVQDGIRRLVSVGYLVHKIENVGVAEDKRPIYKAISWEPLEISIVPIPADITVGVGRNLTINDKGVRKMDNTINVTIEDAIKGEQRRVDEILSLSREFKGIEGVEDKAMKAIRNAMPVDEFRKELLGLLRTANPVVKTDDGIGMSDKEVKHYSITRAINAAVDGKWDRAPFEYEVSKAVEKRYGKPAKGFYIPMEVLKRDLTYTNEAVDTVQTVLDAGNFIEALYKKLVLRQVGARFIEGIVGNVEFPRLSSGSTVYWQSAENTAVSESTPTFDKVTLSPKSMGAIVDVSKLLLNQSSLSVDALILDDIARRIAVGIDTAALVGSGSGEPAGVITVAAEADVADDSAIGYNDVVNCETVVSTADADIGNLAYIATPAVRGTLKQTLIATGSPMVVWQTGVNGVGLVNGYNAYVTSVTSGSKLFFGNWADLLIAIFAPGLDITVDPYTNAKSRLVSLVCYLDMDCGVRHAESFALADGAKA